MTENTVDTYRAVLFTAQSILRDVGVPISATSVDILPLSPLPSARRTVFTNSRGSVVFYAPSPSLYPIPLYLSTRPTQRRYHATLLSKIQHYRLLVFLGKMENTKIEKYEFSLFLS